LFVRLSQLAIASTAALQVVDLVRGVLDERRGQYDVRIELAHERVDPAARGDRPLARGEEPERTPRAPSVGAARERVDDPGDGPTAQGIALSELHVQADLRGHAGAQGRGVLVARMHVARQIREGAHERAGSPPAVEIPADRCRPVGDLRELHREALGQLGVALALLDHREAEMDHVPLAGEQAEGLGVMTQVAGVVEEEEDPEWALGHGRRVPPQGQ
jgi:hypothetical protein